MIIEESTDIKLVLDASNENPEDIEFARNYRSMELKNLTEVNEGQFKKMIQFDNPSKLKEITFKNCVISDKFLLCVLKAAPMLQSLYFISCEVFQNEEDEYADPFPMMRKLTKLHLGSESWIEITNILKNVVTLKEFLFKPRGQSDFEEYSGTDEENNADFKAVIEFIQRQKNIATLEIRNGAFFEEPFQVPDEFQLVDINLFIPELTREQMSNLLSFVKTQRQIEDCVINIMPVSGHSHKLIRTLQHIIGLPSLKSLGVVFYENCTMISQFLNLSVANSNVSKLTLVPSAMKKTTVKHFMQQVARMFPKLKSLELGLDAFERSLLSSELKPLNSLKHLEELHLDGGESCSLRGVNIPSLKEIKMNDYDPRVENWDIFTANHPKLVSVNIQLCIDNALDVAHKLSASIIKKLPTLEILKICTCHQLMTVEETKDIAKLVKEHSSIKLWYCCGKAEYKKELEAKSGLITRKLVPLRSAVLENC